MNHAAAPILLSDYAPPAYLVETVALDVDIRDGGTRVNATLTCARNPATRNSGEWTLDG